MNKRNILLVGVFLSLLIIIPTIITLVRSSKMQVDIEEYLDSHFSNLHSDEFYKVSDSPYFIYAGYQNKTDFPALYIYHYEDNDLEICAIGLMTHDGLIDNGKYSRYNQECKDYLFFGNTGFTSIILKYDKGETIDFTVEDDSIRVNEINYFEDEDFVVFYYYGSLQDNKSVIVEGETLFFK